MISGGPSVPRNKSTQRAPVFGLLIWIAIGRSPVWLIFGTARSIIGLTRQVISSVVRPSSPVERLMV
jgi:hypothetical protein